MGERDEDNDVMSVTTTVTYVAREMQLAEPILVWTEHGDVVEIPAGTVFRFLEPSRFSVRPTPPEED